ncbi:lipopolysaccharide biosynthesis protein [Thermoclostridium stercorarium]|uniref:lipopolysaccharide biosynthesis protein n=1 Tax=Thermoclostridium stercorarium TaxID=1510 RepID=UPI0022488689|nr:lipopolysaccharide biosynthesis protein [Thermoclostridium stercorarium]UZQ85772.1 lipopolysaccharide biosynthesis protein [Thermoclostridium stercorarium]
MKEENFKSKFANAAKWSTSTQIVARLVAPVTNMILARIISPEAFGVVATVSMVTSFSDMFTDAGFQKYLIQHEFKDEDEKFRYANVAFWTNFCISVFLWLIILIFKEKIAVLVGNPGLGNVIVIACIQLILTSFSSIQMSLYIRDFDFKTLFLVRTVSVCVPFVVTIPLALFGLSYWSIIIGDLVKQLSNAVILTVKSKWKPSFYYRVKTLKEMLSFSVWLLIDAIVNWFNNWVDIFIIGSVLNEYFLGIYKTSTTMVNALLDIITTSIAPVLYTTLSRLQKNDDELNKMYLYAQRLISVLVFPIGIGVFLYSDLATKIFLGNKWGDSSGVIGVYALTSSILIVFGYFCSEVYRAKGSPKLSILAQTLHMVVLVPACIISSRYGFWPLVYTRAWIRMELVFVHLIIMRFFVKMSVASVLKNVMPSAVSAISMGIFGYLLKQINNSIKWSIMSILICSIFYFGILCLFPNMRKDIVNFVNRFMPVKYKNKVKTMVKERCVKNNM